jgi:hypothetical protein
VANDQNKLSQYERLVVKVLLGLAGVSIVFLLLSWAFWASEHPAHGVLSQLGWGALQLAAAILLAQWLFHRFFEDQRMPVVAGARSNIIRAINENDAFYDFFRKIENYMNFNGEIDEGFLEKSMKYHSYQRSMFNNSSATFQAAITFSPSVQLMGNSAMKVFRIRLELLKMCKEIAETEPKSLQRANALDVASYICRDLAQSYEEFIALCTADEGRYLYKLSSRDCMRLSAKFHSIARSR